MHRESQVLIENQQGLSANRKSSERVARPGLIERKSAQRRATAGEEPFGKRDVGGKGAAVRRLHAKTDRARKHEPAADGGVGGILHKDSKEIPRRADGLHRYGHVDI